MQYSQLTFNVFVTLSINKKPHRYATNIFGELLSLRKIV